MRFTELVSVINPLFSPPKFRARLSHQSFTPSPHLSGTNFNNGFPILHIILIFRVRLNDNFRCTIGGKSTHTPVYGKLLTESFNLVKNLSNTSVIVVYVIEEKKKNNLVVGRGSLLCNKLFITIFFLPHLPRLVFLKKKETLQRVGGWIVNSPYSHSRLMTSMVHIKL